MARPKKSKAGAAAAAGAGAGGASTTRDVESNADNNNNNNQQQTRINNPYSSSSAAAATEPNILPTYHPLNVLKRLLYIGGATYGFHNMLDAPNTILYSPIIRHEIFKIGIATTILILFIKAYVELYAGKVQKQTINYNNFRTTTHVVLVLIMLTSTIFHIALWPYYGYTTFIVLFLLGVILLNIALLLPTSMQNFISIIFVTFFLQQYK